MAFVAFLITRMLVFLCIFCSGRTKSWSWAWGIYSTCLPWGFEHMWSETCSKSMIQNADLHGRVIGDNLCQKM